MKSVERRRGGFAFVKSIISIGLAAQMLLSSMLVSPEPVQQDVSGEITASEEVLLEQNEQNPEIIEEVEYTAPNEPGSLEENLSESDNPTGEDPHEGQKEEGNEPGILSAREQGFDLTTGSGIQVFAFFGEDAGLPEETSLEVIEDRLAAESVTPLLGDYSLYSDPNERAGVEQYLKGCLNLDGWDFLIQADVLDFSLWENGEMFIPAAPMTAELRLDMLPESMAPYVTVIGLDGDTAGLRLAKGTAENGAVVLRFEIPCPTRLAICVSAYEYLYWNKEGWDFRVYGPEGAQLGSEEAVIDAGGMKVQEAQNLVCYTEDGSWAGLWVAVRPSEDVLEEVPGAELYALSNGVRTELPSENGYTYRPIYLYDANGFALLTPPDAEETEYAGLTEEPGTEPGDLQEPDGINQDLLEENPALPVDVTENVPEENALEENVPEENAPEENVPEENAPEENVPEENAPEENLPEENGAEPQTEQNLGDDVNTETVIEDPANESNPEPGAEETPSEGGVEENVSDAVETVSTSDVMKDGDSEPAAVEAADSSETDVVGGNEPETYTEKNLETGFDALGLSGSMPEGVDASVTDALAQLAELDLAKLENGQSGMEESLPDYHVLAAWELNLTRNGETWQPDEYSVLTASVSHEEISKERDLQLWRVEYDAEGQPRTVRLDDFTAEDGVLTFPVTESGVYAVTCTAGFRSETVTVVGDALPAGISVDMTSVDFDVSQLNDLPGQTVDEMAPISLNAPVLNLGRVTMVNSFNAAPPSLDTAPADEAAAASDEVSDTGKSAPRYEVITAYDISLYQNELGYQPDAEHPLTITIKDEGIRRAVQEGHELQLWHVHDGAAPVQIENFNVSDDTLSFVVDSLSVFVVTYTVDFHWGDYTYSIEGESEITLSALLEKLGVTEIALADVAGVSFTNPAYIEIEQLDADWLLKSLAPFDSDEALVLTLKNGEIVEIKVTDATGDITAPVPIENLVYNGSEQELITAGSVEGGGTLEYRLGETGNYSTEIPKAKNAGDYTIYYKAENTENVLGSVTATIKLKVTFMDGDTEVGTRYLKVGDPIGDLPSLTGNNCDFAGWYNGENEIKPDASFTGNTTLTARYTVTVSFVAYGAETTPGPVVLVKGTEQIGSNLLEVSRDGYRFDGWYNNPELTGEKVTVESTFAAHTTLYAKFVEQVKIDFELSRTEADETTTTPMAESSVMIDKGTALSAENYPALEYNTNLYAFKGWFVGDKRIDTQTDPAYTFNAVATVTARLVRQTTVTYKAENASGEYTFREDKGDVNRTVTFPDNPRFPVDETQNETADFKGWYKEDGTQASNNFTAAEDMTLTAHYTVTVNFIVKDAQYNNVTSTTPVVIDKGTALGDKLLKNPVLTGDYKFLGWFVMREDGKPDETQPVTADSPEFSAHTNVVAKFAHFVTIAFLYGGTRQEFSVPDRTQVSLLENPNEVGSRFDGWFEGDTRRTDARGLTDADGKLVQDDWMTELPEGADPVRYIVATRDMELSAKFVKQITVNFLVVNPEVLSSAGTPSVDVQKTVTIDSGTAIPADMHPTNPYVSTYVFEGWYTIKQYTNADGNPVAKYSDIPVSSRDGVFVLDKNIDGVPYVVDKKLDDLDSATFVYPTDPTNPTAPVDPVTLAIATNVVAKITKQVNITFAYEQNGIFTQKAETCRVGNKLLDYEPSDARKEGFRLEWFKRTEGATDETPVTAETIVARADNNAVVTARYTEAVKLTFQAEGSEDQIFVIDKGKSAADHDLTWPGDPKVPGAIGTFIGWYNGNTKYTRDTIVTESVTLTPKYGYTVTFMAHTNEEQGHTNDVSVETRGVEAGTAIGALPDAPFWAEHNFKEWLDEDNAPVGADYVPAKDVTITAYYVPVSICTVEVNYYVIKKDNNGTVTSKTLTDYRYLAVDKNSCTAENPLVIESPNSFKQNDGEYFPVMPYIRLVPDGDTVFTFDAAVIPTNGSAVYDSVTKTVTVNPIDVTLTYDDNTTVTIAVPFVAYDAQYTVKHMLLKLNGNPEEYSSDYTEITSETETGVKGKSGVKVMLQPKDSVMKYADLQKADLVEIANGATYYVYYTRKEFTLSYNTMGGSSVKAERLPYGTTKTLPTGTAAPTRTGYEFKGWYKTEQGAKNLTSSEKITQVTLDENMVNAETGTATVYAGWTGDTANYTITYLVEKFDDTGANPAFVYEKSIVKQGSAGTTVSASTAPELTSSSLQLQCYEADTEKNAASSVEIAANGSSVLYVYYKLKTYTLIFDRNHQSYCNDYIIRPDGTTTTDQYSFEVKLGQDISKLWPSADSDYYYFMGWQKNGQGTRYVTKQLIMNTDLIPSSGNSLTFYANWGYAYTFTVNYYLQNADDDGYTRSEQYSQTYNADSYGLSPKVINGYTFDHGNNDTYDTTYNLYYKRNTYKIDYYYSSTNLKTIENIKFDANINKSPYIWTPTAAQCGVDTDYTFDGWYSDSDLTTEYTFSKMPSSNLVLYAKWTPPTKTVTFHLNNGQTQDIYCTATVTKGGLVADHRPAELETVPTWEGHVFNDWYYDSVNDTAGIFEVANTQVTEDLQLYAHWDPLIVTEYKVQYRDENGGLLTKDGQLLVEDVTRYVRMKVGDAVTENAPYIAGYSESGNDALIADAASKTLELTGNPETDVITFYYSKRPESIFYEVHYVLLGSDPAVCVLAAAPTGTDTAQIPGATVTYETRSGGEIVKRVKVSGGHKSVTEWALSPTKADYADYRPTAVTETLELSRNELKNVITFYYTKGAEIKVSYVDMAGGEIKAPQTFYQEAGKPWTLDTTLSGYTFHHAGMKTNGSDEQALTAYTITPANNTDKIEIKVYYQYKLSIIAKSASRSFIDGKVLTGVGDVDVRADENYVNTGSSDKVKANGLKDGHTIREVTLTGGRLYAGVSSNTPSAVVIDGLPTGIPAEDTKDSNGNTTPGFYDISYIPGTISVTKIIVNISLEPDRWTGNVYDGTEKPTGFTNPTKEISEYIIISDDIFRGKYLRPLWDNLITALESELGEGNYQEGNSVPALKDAPGFAVIIHKIDVGDYNLPRDRFETAFNAVLNNLENGALKDSAGNTVAYDKNSYEIHRWFRGSMLEIKNRQVKIVTEAAEKPYDGTELTRPNLSVNVYEEVKKDDGTKVWEWVSKAPTDGNKYELVNGDIVTITATGSQTHPGTSRNTYTIDWGNVKSTNYDIQEELGKLTVTSRPLFIEAQDAYKFFGAKSDPAFAVKVYPGRYVQDVDANGGPVLDENNQPKTHLEPDTDNPIPATLTRWQGDNYTLQLNDSARGYTENLSIKITREAGNIPGTYVITPTWAEDAVKNFEASFVNGKLTIGIARVSNDNGATWTYHQWLENDSTNYPESAYTEGTNDPSEQGAFDKARALGGDVIVETLCSNDDFGTYGIADRFVLKKQVKLEEETLHELTLRKTDGVKTSVIYRGYDGGSLFTTKCAFTVENITLDGDKDTYSASTDGGLVHVQAGGSLTVNSGATLQNSATSGKGGAIYAAGPDTDNSGAAVYVNSGALITGNSATNGNAVFVDDNASMTMTGGAITGNNNTVGGAVEIGGAGASLTFSGDALVYDNPTGGAQRNVYLNYESADNEGAGIINAVGLTASAKIGVYVEDDVAGATTATGALFKKRGGVLNRFGTYSNISNLSAFINDRNDLRGTARDKNNLNEIIWFQPITVQVRYIRSMVNEDVMPEPAANIYLLEPGKYIVVDEIQYVPSYYNSDLPYDPNATEPIDLQNTGFTVEAIAQDIYRFHDRWGVANADKLGFWRGYAESEISYVNTSESLRSNPTENPQLEPKSEYGKWSFRTINPETLTPAENEKLVLYYMPYVCKITDADGNLLRVNGKIQAFQTLEAAFTAYGDSSLVFTKADGITPATPTYIKMLVEDYALKPNTQITVPASKPVILTTAATTDTLEELPGPYDGTAATRCVIYRGACTTSMFSVPNGATFGIENIILDGENIGFSGNGGIINSYGILNVNTGAALRNGIAANGGAIYANAGSTLNMTGGEIIRNTAANNGAGIFLAQNSLMNISGNPSFGGTGINAANGNYMTGTLSGKHNGGVDYTKARQDIYIAGYLGKTEDDPTPAASLNVNGAITSDAGSIWVWAEIPVDTASDDVKEYNHYKQLKQFATYTGTTPSEDTLKAFRNAVDDERTENSTGEYLSGSLEGELTGKFIYWTGNAGYRKVILRAVTDNGTAYSAGGGKYTVYKGTTANVAKDVDGNLLPTEMQPGASGVFWIGILPYGDYTITDDNNNTWTLTVNDDTPKTKEANGATAETAPGSRDGVTVKES